MKLNLLRSGVNEGYQGLFLTRINKQLPQAKNLRQGSIVGMRQRMRETCRVPGPTWKHSPRGSTWKHSLRGSTWKHSLRGSTWKHSPKRPSEVLNF